MAEHVLVWDLETVPDLAAVARVHGLANVADPEARAALGEGFPKLPYHQIVCIGALVAERRSLPTNHEATSASSLRATRSPARVISDQVCG